MLLLKKSTIIYHTTSIVLQGFEKYDFNCWDIVSDLTNYFKIYNLIIDNVSK